MKKIGLLLLLPGFIAGLVFFQHQKTIVPENTAFRIPGGPTEENHEKREAWELRRYADPATGRIPAGASYWDRQFAAGLPKAASDRSGSTWASRGPWNIGGRSRAIAIDVSNEKHLLAGGVTGGLWSSDDGGQSWTRRTPPDAHPGCVSIAQDTRPGKTDTWYYLGGEISGASAFAPGAFYFGDGVYKSTDGGQNWDLIPSTSGGNPQSFTTAFQTGYRIATSPADTADVVYMACYGVIFRSTDGGANWTVARGTTNLSTGGYYTDVAVTSTGVVYATISSDGTQKGIWRSPDGVNWTNILPASFPATYDRIVIGINPDNEDEVYFLAVTPGSGHVSNYFGGDDWTSLYQYTYLGGDGSGANGQWDDRSLNLPNTGNDFERFACQGGYDLAVKVQPGAGSVFIGGTNVYRSTDGFATPHTGLQIGGWKIGTTSPFFESYPNHHPDQHDFVFLPSNPKVMLTASDGGIARTDDCTASPVVWTSLNRGYLTTQAYTAIIDQNAPGDNTLIGCFQDNANYFVNSTDPTAPWKITVNGDGAFGGIAHNKAFYILSINGGKVAKVTLDNTGKVTALRRIDPIGPNPDDYLFINPLALDPNDDNLLYVPAGNRLYRQDELANIQLTGEWDSIAQGWTQFPDAAAGTISAIAVSKANPTNRVYIGTDARRIYRIDNANTGTPSFTATALISVPGTANVSCIAIDPDNADRVIVAYSNYSVYSIWLSENAGQSWQKVAGNLETSSGGSGSGPSIRWITILPYPDGSRKYFCATSVGLFSADSLELHSPSLPGTKWTLESPDLIGNCVVDYVDSRASDGLVIAATHGIGLYSANFMPVSGSHEQANTPVVQVSPNPAVTYANFTLGNASSGTVSVRLFDLNGRLIRQAEWSGPGGRLDMQGLDSGVYLYELQGPGWRKSGKIVK